MESELSVRQEAMKKKEKTVGCQWMEKITVKWVREEIKSNWKEMSMG